MKTVWLTKGLPASGKTTWAKEKQASNIGGIKRVNKDDIRAMLDDGHWSKSNEKFVLALRDETISRALFEGKHVIVDDTNLHPKHEQHIKQLVKGQAQVKIQDFTHVSVEQCIEWDLVRPNSVGSKVIQSMYDNFLKPEIESVVSPEYDISLSDAIIVDMDGTLAHMGDRSPYDVMEAMSDTVNFAVQRLTDAMHDDAHILIVTGRDGSGRDIVVNWLEHHAVRYSACWSRAAGDNRKDSIVKREIYDRHIRGKYNILFVLDDRDQVVNMWRNELGLQCFQVAEGDF